MAKQIIINVEDSSILPSLRKILSLIKGISIVEKQETNEKDSTQDCSTYQQSLDDIKNGRINTYKNTEEFFGKMGI